MVSVLDVSIESALSRSSIEVSVESAPPRAIPERGSKGLGLRSTIESAPPATSDLGARISVIKISLKSAPPTTATWRVGARVFIEISIESAPPGPSRSSTP